MCVKVCKCINEWKDIAGPPFPPKYGVYSVGSGGDSTGML